MGSSKCEKADITELCANKKTLQEVSAGGHSSAIEHERKGKDNVDLKKVQAPYSPKLYDVVEVDACIATSTSNGVIDGVGNGLYILSNNLSLYPKINNAGASGLYSC